MSSLQIVSTVFLGGPLFQQLIY